MVKAPSCIAMINIEAINNVVPICAGEKPIPSKYTTHSHHNRVILNGKKGGIHFVDFNHLKRLKNTNSFTFRAKYCLTISK